MSKCTGGVYNLVDMLDAKVCSLTVGNCIYCECGSFYISFFFSATSNARIKVC